MSKNFASTIAGASILITGIGLVSKGFGFLREIIYANNFGLQTNFDIYLIGAVLPITINTSVFYLAQNYFIPIYNKKLFQGKDHASKFLSESFWLFLILSFFLSLLLFVFSSPLIRLYLTSPSQSIYTTALTIFQIFLFTVPINACYSILSSYFQAEYNFKVPAYSTLFQNILIIVLVLLFTKSIGIFTIPIGYLLGTIAQFIYLLFSMKGRNYLAPKIIFPKPIELSNVNKTLAIIIIVEFVNQLYNIIDRYFYGSVDSGGLAALNYATVLYSLPISIISFALSTALFPRITHSFTEKDISSSKSQYLSGLQVNILLFIPITFVFIFFGETIIRLFYQRGNYSSDDTVMTFQILKWYSLSLIFYSSYAIINKVVYGAGLVNGLLKISIGIFILKIIANYYLVELYKQNGLAFSTSISYILLSISCYFLVAKNVNLKIGRKLINGAIFYFVNAGLCYIVIVLVKNYLHTTSGIGEIILSGLFIVLYAINIIIIKPSEFLILKQVLVKYTS
ncbi:MAG: polysaccharide biosynthesis C-terminal domain-containing protein [Ignavibacteriaceae bacterium]|nr:polysaccharide biosynthesis C-terminal domain-containing protein [Ignavibacteriaceae bacterium]